MNESNIIHREKTGLREYVITSENQEVIDSWRKQVEEILEAIRTNDQVGLFNLMREGKYHPEYAQKALEKFSDASDEKKKLLAIALWILRDQAHWSGVVKTAIPFLKGGQKEIAQLMEKGESPSCLDSSVLVLTMASQMGLHGSIKKTGTRLSHRYFESAPSDQAEPSTIVDVWWAYKEGGIIDDENKMSDLKKRNDGISHICKQAVHEVRQAIDIRKNKTAMDILRNPELYGVKEYIGLEELPQYFMGQVENLADERLQNVRIIVVPDKFWSKGDQPSESVASQKAVLFKQSYFEDKNNKDEIAWMTHELAHCQKYFDLQSDEAQYKTQSSSKAFPELAGEFTYPNNQVERHAFGRQFDFLMKNGWTRDQIITALKHEYRDSEDFDFFNKILDELSLKK